MIRATIGQGAARAREAVQVATHIADYGEGPVRVAPAAGMVAGSFSSDDGVELVMLTLYVPVAGIGLCETLNVDEARALADALVATAAEIEAKAAAAAAAALKKAAGR